MTGSPAKPNKHPWRHVMTSERRRMRELRSEGLTFTAIGKIVGRSENTVKMHVRDIVVPGKAATPESIWRAARQQRLIDRCNAALAGAP